MASVGLEQRRQELLEELESITEGFKKLIPVGMLLAPGGRIPQLTVEQIVQQEDLDRRKERWDQEWDEFWTDLLEEMERGTK